MILPAQQGQGTFKEQGLLCSLSEQGSPHPLFAHCYAGTRAALLLMMSRACSGFRPITNYVVVQVHNNDETHFAPVGAEVLADRDLALQGDVLQG